MAFSKTHFTLCFCLAIQSTFAQSSNYAQPQKVQLEDIEQDNLKTSQQSTSNQGSASIPQYTQYVGQNQPFYYNSLAHQAHQAPSVVSPGSHPSQPQSQPQQQQLQIPLYALAQAGPAPVGGIPQPQQPFIYYTQAPQQLSPYDLPSFFSAPGYHPFAVPQSIGSSAAAAAGNLHDFYKSAQASPSQTTSGGKQPGSPVPVKSALPQLPANFYFPSALPPQYFPSVNYAHAPSSQFLGTYNSFYPLQTAQKSIYSSGVKSTTPAAPTKNSDPINGGNSNYRFEYNPEFTKLRVAG